MCDNRPPLRPEPRGRRTSFGQLLRRHRQAAGLTQEALAQAAGLSVDAIGLLERGIRRSPRRSTVQLLADALALGPPERQRLVAAARPEARAPEPALHLSPDLPLPAT